MALMFLDLDRQGHQAGDALLVECAHRLNALVRKTDTVAKLVGDEFTIILEDLEHPQHGAEVVAHKILDSVQQPFDIAGQAATVTASIGLAMYDGKDGDVDVADLLQRADQGMYAAKHAGKNVFKVA